ncbi:hypothetical protein CKALI_11125 [Corynebacterium kalinowskii]|uniref:Uncharacterized protein n=1 Tax=Corynebacterium kalinowskii TaxID=2675216 RepID=A0A6B8VT37_9CORY|nr:hypothetical protein [Corynebacterium kalinowskii]QGU03071.1 hypothetical protein CKALI_11125 [Corynebacterium kalinowskii]
MNSLKSMQRRFRDIGEVVLTAGWRSTVFAFFGFGLGLAGLCSSALIFGRLVDSNVPVGERALSAVWAIFLGFSGLLFLIGAVMMLTGWHRRVHRLRVTRQGLHMAGLTVPWEGIYAAELHDFPRGRFKNWRVLYLTLAPKNRATQVAWDDGSKNGQKLVESVNESRAVTFFTHVLNVRSKTLLKFVVWARRECAGPLPHERSDLNFEQL